MSSKGRMMQKRSRSGVAKRITKRDLRSRFSRMTDWTGLFTLGFLKFMGRVILTLSLLVVTLVATTLAFLLFTPELTISGERLAKVLKYLPATVQIQWQDAGIEIKSATAGRSAEIANFSFAERHLQKHVTVHADKLCVKYADPAVRACFDRVALGLSGGWGTEPKWSWIPGLKSIDPIQVLGGVTNVDVTAFPPTDPDDPPSNFSIADLLRNQLLPRWNLDGSEVDLNEMNLKLKDDAYHARFQLTTREHGETLRLALDQFSSRSGLVSAGGLIRVIRGSTWDLALGKDARSNANGAGGGDVNSASSVSARPQDPRAKSEGSREIEPWRIFADAHAKIQKKMDFVFKADANVQSWNSLDLRLMTKTRGIVALREARIEAKYRESKVDGVFSLKLGASGSQVKATDFVNCLVGADLDAKTGVVRCGPQAVRLQIREVAALAHPELFILAPAFDLRLSNLEFGSVKSGDLKLDLNLDHLGLLTLRSKFDGHFEQKSGSPFAYKLGGHAELMNQDFARVVKILNPTPFSVPAPFNVLNGKIALNADLDLNQSGGSVHYELRPDLDSEHQAVHIRLSGETDYVTHADQPNAQMELATDISVLVDSLRVSAPRFDLAIPPQLVPDGRFHRIRVTGADSKKPGIKITPALNLGTEKNTVSPGVIAAGEATRVTDSPAAEKAAVAKSEAGKKSSQTVAGAGALASKAIPSAAGVVSGVSPGVASGSTSAPSKDVAASATPMRFRLRLKTSAERAIQIATSLTKTVVPIDADITYASGNWGGIANPPPEISNFEGRNVLSGNSPLTIANSGPRKKLVAQTTGFIWFGETKLDLFRRNATLDHLRVDFLANGGERLEGRAGVHYLQYDIAVLINGEPAHPQISFMSRPELENQQQIIAVLLFGRPMTELNQNDKSSVSNLQAAFADAALGAGSLYLLANTPIESVGYDPTSQSLRATVGLGGGASIDVGTTDSIGFNKTISREFTFRTEVDKLASSGQNTVSAMIEWVKGF